MNSELALLLLTAISVGFIHTVLGPDHYIPFIVMSRARHWSRTKTIWVTTLCGLGHVGSSIALGLIGVAMGFAVSRLEGLESLRGNIAGWGLIAFGFVYGIWGLRRALHNRPHTHTHLFGELGGITHRHFHELSQNHTHENERKSVTPWILFTIFVLGPCEPLIPILMYPAAQQSMTGLVMVTVGFAFVTLATMNAAVILSLVGLKFLPVRQMERFSHAIAGVTIFLCGVSVQLLGL